MMPSSPEDTRKLIAQVITLMNKAPKRARNP
jgi:hypothetical protein